MRPFVRLRSILLASKKCRPLALHSHPPSPSAPQLYTTKSETVNTSARAKEQNGAEIEDDIDSFDLGFDDWTEVDPKTKTIETAVGSLPISPLLDPTWREARQRKKEKLLPNRSKFNRFQRRVEESPYAQLLAGPVRSCDLTKAYLPMAFMQSFGLVKHPESGDTWWIPGDFETSSSQLTTTASDEIESGSPAANGDDLAPSSEFGPDAFAAAQNDRVADAGHAEHHQEPVAEQAHKFFAPAHVLARQDLLLQFFVGKSYYASSWERLAGSTRIGRRGAGATWRQDMHEVLRDQSRRQITNELVYLARLCEEENRNYFVRVDSDDDLKGYEQNRSCYLQLGEGKCEPFGVLEIDGLEGSARPVYDLPALLSPEGVQHLASEVSLFGDAPMLLVRGERTVKLNKMLWKLQGFLAEY